jgi:hypothetical protein
MLIPFHLDFHVTMQYSRAHLFHKATPELSKPGPVPSWSKSWHLELEFSLMQEEHLDYSSERMTFDPLSEHYDSFPLLLDCFLPFSRLFQGYCRHGPRCQIFASRMLECLQLFISVQAFRESLHSLCLLFCMWLTLSVDLEVLCGKLS